MRVDDAGHRHPAAGDLLDDERVGEQRLAEAAVLLADREPEQAHLLHALDDRLGELVLVLEVGRVRDDLLVHERLHRATGSRSGSSVSPAVWARRAIGMFLRDRARATTGACRGGVVEVSPASVRPTQPTTGEIPLSRRRRPRRPGNRRGGATSCRRLGPGEHAEVAAGCGLEAQRPDAGQHVAGLLDAGDRRDDVAGAADDEHVLPHVGELQHAAAAEVEPAFGERVGLDDVVIELAVEPARIAGHQPDEAVHGLHPAERLGVVQVAQDEPRLGDLALQRGRLEAGPHRPRGQATGRPERRRQHPTAGHPPDGPQRREVGDLAVVDRRGRPRRSPATAGRRGRRRSAGSACRRGSR